MEYKAHLRYLRIAPRKVRLVADSIRGKSVREAERGLKFMAQKSALPILKLLRSAIANAKNNFSIGAEKLFVKKITVDKGPILKRIMPRARGSASPIHKHTSHISITLTEK